MRVEHILLTTDLSGEALRAFEPVLELAEKLGARVSVLYVVPDIVASPHGAPLAPPIHSPSLPRETEKAKRAVTEQCEQLETSVDVSCEVIEHPSPAKGIVEYAAKHDVDLIALSTHGHTGLRRIALGSVAEEVLRRSPVPVLSFQRPE